jgi:hypothetical protein
MWFGKKSEPDWRDSFVAVARQVFSNETLTFEEASEALRSASTKQLLELDWRSRRGISAYVRRSGNRPGAVLRMALTNPHDADVFLFFGSCDGNGYIREQALRALRGHAGKLACAAALIRSDDWVPQVAEIASRMLHDVAAADGGRHLFELLGLILALQSRRRFRPQWVATLEPLLLAPRWREARLAALRSPTATARRLAHDLIHRADPDRACGSLRRAIGDPTPLVGLWGLARVQDLADPSEQHELLRQGLLSRLASIRSEALRRYCRAGYPDLREVLDAAIFDRSHSVRTVAAYQLGVLFNASALIQWRRAFDGGNHGEGMIMSLAENGETPDASRLRSQLTHDRGRIRALALRGLLRIGAADSEALLAAAMRDPSSHVIGAAIRAYTRGIDSLTAAVLADALAHTTAPGPRARLIGASRLLPKWDRLQLLLALYPGHRDTDREPLDAAVRGWIVRANHSFIEPRARQRLLIRHALETARSLHPARLWDRVLHLL